MEVSLEGASETKQGEEGRVFLTGGLVLSEDEPKGGGGGGKRVEHVDLDNLVRPESEDVFKEGRKHHKDTKISFKGSYWPNINLRRKK